MVALLLSLLVGQYSAGTSQTKVSTYTYEPILIAKAAHYQDRPQVLQTVCWEGPTAMRQSTRVQGVRQKDQKAGRPEGCKRAHETAGGDGGQNGRILFFLFDVT